MNKDIQRIKNLLNLNKTQPFKVGQEVTYNSSRAYPFLKKGQKWTVNNCFFREKDQCWLIELRGLKGHSFQSKRFKN